ncbi:MAG: hypothetical protein M3305_15590 [Actinomycetota bacterium]|nr:hypothetical protein [Actinomycetota bacterium]
MPAWSIALRTAYTTREAREDISMGHTSVRRIVHRCGGSAWAEYRVDSRL